ncbi:DNA translocase FtsK [Helicobacter anatolicus]|uniref:DNA translocase FtsK n=1 Tax=Helicobacter anatolicus TaxID=2905874 RepID=UPI001E5C9C99|nr:DNA translocase FtsK [Helicobacter anatolicus]MCE3038213.1 DNA translocase FtsK [Helicobacter anatolicus]
MKIKKIVVCLFLASFFVFLFLATIFGAGGFVGEFGRGFSYFNNSVFGILAPVWPILLLYPLYLYGKYGTFSTEHTQYIFAGFLSFFIVICLQALWIDKGGFGQSVIRVLSAIIGTFGIYVLLLAFGIVVWVLFSLQHFLQAIQKLRIAALRFLENFGKKIIQIFKNIKQKIKEKRLQKSSSYNTDHDFFQRDFKEQKLESPIDFVEKNTDEGERFLDIEPKVRVFYDIKVGKPKENTEVREYIGGEDNSLEIVQNHDYVKEVLERNKREAQKQIALISEQTKNQKTRDEDFLSAQAAPKPLVQDLHSKTPQSPQKDTQFFKRQEDLQRNTQDFGSSIKQNTTSNTMQSVEKNTKSSNSEDSIDPSLDFIVPSNNLDNTQSDLKEEKFEINTSDISENSTADFTPKVARKSKIQILKEVSQNTMLLEDLEKGGMQKPQNYSLPSLDLLTKPPLQNCEIDEEEIDMKAQNLIEKLKTFKIEGDVTTICTGPLISTFEFKPAGHVKVSRISNLSDDLAMTLSAQSIRIQAPIPGKNVVGIEIPNTQSQIVYMREILESEIFKQSASPLTLALGKDIAGNPFVTDLKKLPHLLVAGTTGSGKSVGINAMILSLLYRNSPDSLRLIMVDPKMVEFSLYEDIPHLLTPIITDAKKAISALNQATKEMEKRYKMMQELKVKTIESYNQKCKAVGLEPFAYLVIIIDELADLMMTGGKDAEMPIIRIAQMGRACGMHLIVATQRPSADVVTGLIKTNLPSRIAFKVSNKIDSRVVIDMEGAQSLLGKGDMLFALGGSNVTRIHAPWSSEGEIERIVESIKMQREVVYDEEFDLEGRELIEQNFEGSNVDSTELQRAKEVILTYGISSTSNLQRRMGVGYNKAANLVEELERQGFLSAPDAKGKRSIIGR